MTTTPWLSSLTFTLRGRSWSVGISRSLGMFSCYELCRRPNRVSSPTGQCQLFLQRLSLLVFSVGLMILSLKREACTSSKRCDYFWSSFYKVSPPNHDLKAVLCPLCFDTSDLWIILADRIRSIIDIDTLSFLSSTLISKRDEEGREEERKEKGQRRTRWEWRRPSQWHRITVLHESRCRWFE